MSYRDGRVMLTAWVEPVVRDSAREAARLAGLDFSRWVERAVMAAMSAESVGRAIELQRRIDAAGLKPRGK